MASAEQRETFMKRAIALCRQKAVDEGEGMPFAAIIVKDGQIIAKGWNRVIEDCDPTCHGEVDAIRKACTHLKRSFLTGCDLYATCEPCLMCTAVVWRSRLDNVYYAGKLANMTFRDNSQLYADLQAPTDSRSTPYQQLSSLEQTAQQVFNDWLKAYPTHAAIPQQRPN